MYIARDNPAVKSDVYPALSLRGGYFFFKAPERGGGGDGVEGHVDYGGDAARRGGEGAGVEAFPFCAAGFVEVDVGVDEAGEEDVGGVVFVGGAWREGGAGDDGGVDGGDFAGEGGYGDCCGRELVCNDCSRGGEDRDGRRRVRGGAVRWRGIWGRVGVVEGHCCVEEGFSSGVVRWAV